LVEDLNNRTMRYFGKSRRQLFNEIERDALSPLPQTPFEYAEWKTAKVHPDYHVEVDKSFYSVPHGLIGQRVRIRLTQRVVEIFYDYQRVASHVRSGQRNGHITLNEHMPQSHRQHANTTPASLMGRAMKIGPNTAILVERMLSERRHPEQAYRAVMGILSLVRRYEPQRVEAACERALIINAVTYSSVNSILKSGLDKAGFSAQTGKSLPLHTNIRGSKYYH